ncbi:MAG: NADH-quinone oxidoreductase subunit C [Candidatus Thorarchaeota archaeon]
MKHETIEPASLSRALKSQHAISNIETEGNLLSFFTNPETYVELASNLCERGFSRCLTVAVVDWIEQNEFEAYYIVHHLEANLYVKVTTRIPRNKPRIQSLAAIWQSAAMHEREMWELFGINYVGNPMLKPLFLEDWKGKPPLRKDFNWREYVNKEYYQERGK